MRSTNKIESIQKRVLWLLYNDYTNTSDYTNTYDSLLAKANKPSMEIKRYGTLASEIFKTLNDLNPTYMQDLFYLRSSSARGPNNIAVVRQIQTRMERKALDHWTSDLELFNRTHKSRNFTCTISKSD